MITITERVRQDRQIAARLAVTLPPIILSEPTIADIVLYRGDTGIFRVLVLSAGVPVDVTTATWDCDIRTNEDNPTVMTTLTVSPVAGITNAVDVSIDATQSADIVTSGVWDLEMTMGGNVTTLLRGDVILTKDVSRTP